MLGAGSVFLVSALIFSLYAFVARQEVVRGRRLIFPGVRTTIDSILERTYYAVRGKIGRLYRLTIKLSWYYSIHSALRTVLTLLVKMYDRIELAFNNNRERAKQLRAEKKALSQRNHLTEIQEHKEAMALTSREKKKLKDKSLKG
jgi:hypothetical protein